MAEKEQYNELTIEEFIERPESATKYLSWNTNQWCRCTCSCGETVFAPYYGVKKGLIKSCGHVRSDTSRKLMKELKKDYPVPRATYFTYKGQTLNLSEWSKRTGIPRSTISYRLEHEWPPEKILEGGEGIGEEAAG